LALVLTVSLAACGGSDEKSDSTVPPTIGDAVSVQSTDSTGSSSATTETSDPTVTTIAGGPVGTPEADRAAADLYAAWKQNDKTAAARVADPSAVAALFASPAGDFRLYNKCNTGEFDSAACLYRGDAGTIQFRMSKRGDNWVVVEAFYSES